MRAGARCEDTPDATMAEIADAAGASYRTCAEARAAGRCDEELAKEHCAATCDACPDRPFEVGDRHPRRDLGTKSICR